MTKPTTIKKKTTPLAPKKQTATAKKAPLLKPKAPEAKTQPKPATAVKPKEVATQEAVTEAAPLPEQMPVTEPKPEEKAPEKGFSKGEIEEINIDLGIEPEADIEADQEPINIYIDANEALKPDRIIEETRDNGQVTAALVDLAATEKQSKDMFYKILCGSFDIANNKVSKGQPEGPYSSLDLKSYGVVSRDASDQFFDRMCDVPFIKRMLFKLNESVLVEKWGAIIMLGYSIHNGFKEEHTLRLKERSLSSAANDDVLKEPPLKEEAA